ncbi:hypothetical protein GPJ56_004031 [Histomonas meleagridis]|nr:hypothetical protein GPJ56_004031 [Histomonas meleagridis]
MAENETERLYEPELLRSETEIVLDDENENVNEEKTSDVKITKKAVKDLTQEEKEIIIANAKKGIENEFFDVKFFKNGNARVTAKKSKTDIPSVEQTLNDEQVSLDARNSQGSEQKEDIVSSEAQVSEPQEQIYNVPVQRGWRARVQYL